MRSPLTRPPQTPLVLQLCLSLGPFSLSLLPHLVQERHHPQDKHQLFAQLSVKCWKEIKAPPAEECDLLLPLCWVNTLP